MEIYDKNKELHAPNGISILKFIDENKCKKCVLHCTTECKPDIGCWISTAYDKHYYTAECFKAKEESKC